MRWVLGIDIGGTKLIMGAVAEDGSRVVGEQSRPTLPSRGADAIIAELVAMAAATRHELQRQVAGADLSGIGVGAPGPLDTTRGIVFETPNLGWVNMPLRDRIADGVGLPTHLDNDANCAVLGESWVGAARGGRHVLGVTIGTGIGGGIVINGRLHHGAADSAGEIGHMTIDMDGRHCKCGNYGCLEAYASGPAIALRTMEVMRSGAVSTISGLVAGDLDRITAQTVYEAAAMGDEVARDVVRDTAQYLGTGIANLVNAFNPDLVVVMGGVTQAGDRLIDALRRVVAQRAFKPAVDACRIVPGSLGGLAGVYGAAKAHLDRITPVA